MGEFGGWQRCLSAVVTFINAVIQNFAGDTKERVADYEQWNNYHMPSIGSAWRVLGWCCDQRLESRPIISLRIVSWLSCWSWGSRQNPVYLGKKFELKVTYDLEDLTSLWRVDRTGNATTEMHARTLLKACTWLTTQTDETTDTATLRAVSIEEIPILHRVTSTNLGGNPWYI
jgi:hypothetical protein